MEAQLSLEFLRVVETAAIAAARTMGFGDGHKADEVTVEAMRKTMDSVQMGRHHRHRRRRARRSAHALHRRKSGAGHPCSQSAFSSSGYCGPIHWKAPISAPPERQTQSSSWLPASAEGCCTRLICTWKKIVVGPSCKGAVSLDAPVAENLTSIARRLERDVEDLVVIVLDRPRHEKIDCRHSRGWSAHPANQRRRLVGGHFRRGGRHRSSRGNGNRRRAGRSAYRRGPCVA